jgi:hypothetical protein
MKIRTKYIPSESTTSFCFSELCKRIKKEIKDTYKNLSDTQIKEIFPAVTTEDLASKTDHVPDEVMHALMLRHLKKFSINEQMFEYDSRKNHLGGFRWYVLCPRCKAPNLKLYLPNRYKNKEQLYLCKKCHGLKNSSSLSGATNKYKKVIKPLKRLEAIKTLLLNKNISPDKAHPLLAEYERIERELQASAEYRLFKFQEEHSGMMGSKLP